MTHIIAIALTLAWLAADLYLWHAIRSQELLLVASVGMGAVYAVPFWRYVTSRDRRQQRR